jgi:membrane protein insertase Oxa1/YidC/SpoIIIJ
MDEREVRKEEWVREETRREYEALSCLAGCLGMLAALPVMFLLAWVLSPFVSTDSGWFMCGLPLLYLLVAAIFYNHIMAFFKPRG